MTSGRPQQHQPFDPLSARAELATASGGRGRDTHGRPPRSSSARSRRRLRAAVGAGALVATLGYAGVAGGASYVYYEGVYAAGQAKWSSEQTLTYSHGRSNDGRTICVSALYTNYSQVDPVSCSSTTVQKSYGGGTKRAYSRATTGDGVDGRGRAEW